MTEQVKWKLLERALRCLGAMATAGALALAVLFAADVGLAREYGGMNEALAFGRQLIWWLLAMLVLLIAAIPLTKRMLRSESWREALSWTAASLCGGIKAGARVAVIVAVVALLGMAIMVRWQV